MFLTLSYPDISGSATVLCTKRLLECMAGQPKFEVHCLCTQLPGEASEEQIGNVTVHRIKKTIWKNFIDTCSKYLGIHKKLLNFQKIFMSPIFPCRDPFMLRRYEKKAESLNEKHHYDVIIAEHYGYNTLMTGYTMKKKFPTINFYPLLWDPILGQPRPTYLPKLYVDKRILECEDKINKTADRIFSIQAAKGIYDYHKDSSNGKRVYIDIPGILPPEPEVPTKYLSLIKEGYINITYSGILNQQSRNPEYIINLLNKTSCVSRLNLMFFSKGLSDCKKKELKEEFKGILVFFEYIPIQELHTVYRHSDFLLNISHINANMTPSKIFEYMSYGKPIISTFITDGDSAKRYLDNYPHAISIDQKQSVSLNVEKLGEFILSNYADVEYNTVKRIFSNNTPETLVSMISNV